MPYKARLKTGEPRKRPKPNYAVTNAREYNESLKRRGQLSLYCPDGDLKALFINDAPYVVGHAKRSRTKPCKGLPGVGCTANSQNEYRSDLKPGSWSAPT
ncbi:hypothetical protein [Burkholderia ubonensis]|uniref:hypothetical protein n=1 Tax=Burkholderia ubonensis TaxID=101571 RepID=UPI000A9D0A3B|nr:hypothetical protein [Burkholderia ubonensis]